MSELEDKVGDKKSIHSSSVLNSQSTYHFIRRRISTYNRNV